MREALIRTAVAWRQEATLQGDAPIDEHWSPTDNAYVRAQQAADAAWDHLTPDEQADAADRFDRWFRRYLGTP